MALDNLPLWYKLYKPCTQTALNIVRLFIYWKQTTGKYSIFGLLILNYIGAFWRVISPDYCILDKSGKQWVHQQTRLLQSNILWEQQIVGHLSWCSIDRSLSYSYISDFRRVIALTVTGQKKEELKLTRAGDLDFPTSRPPSNQSIFTGLSSTLSKLTPSRVDFEDKAIGELPDILRWAAQGRGEPLCTRCW